MRIWWRRIVTITTVGGGFAGFVLTLETLLASQEKPLGGIAVFILILLVYSYGIALGLALTEGRNPVRQLLIYFAIQIPWFSSPQFAYHFISGFHVTPGISDGRFVITFHLGSEWLLTFHQMMPWAAGINLFAVAVIVMLIAGRSARKASESERLLSSPFPEY